jgi:hypothetical protein
MNNSLIQDSLQLTQQGLDQAVDVETTFNYWMLVAVLEFLIIVLFLVKDKLKTKETAARKFKTDSLKKTVDFDNIINSSFNSIQLYDQLKVKCHPDRFPTDNEKRVIAEFLFQEIAKNRTNVKRLNELKHEAIEKLKINF